MNINRRGAVAAASFASIASFAALASVALSLVSRCFGQLIASELVRWEKVVKSSKITAE